MYTEWLQIKQVRNLESIQFSPGPGLNFLIGKNASGKTAILEAIFLLSRGRSFRTPRIQEVIQHAQTKLMVFARLKHERDGVITSGLEKGYGETNIRVNGNKIKSISEQSKGIPIVLTTQDSHELVTAGPKERRHWLDWAMFHVEQDYLDIWKAYMRALRHRNILLKKGENRRELYRAWEQAMVESGGYLSRSRQRFLGELSRALEEVSGAMFPGTITLSMTPDWPGQSPDAEIFAENRTTDIKMGYTRVGAHSVDVKIQINKKGVAGVFSRGQTKLFICLLMIAQARVVAERTGIRPLVLVDDYMAELDAASCEYLLTTLASSGLQVFLTNTEQQKSLKNIELYKTFHVERGAITEAATNTSWQ